MSVHLGQGAEHPTFHQSIHYLILFAKKIRRKSVPNLILTIQKNGKEKQLKKSIFLVRPTAFASGVSVAPQKCTECATLKIAREISIGYTKKTFFSPAALYNYRVLERLM